MNKSYSTLIVVVLLGVGIGALAIHLFQTKNCANDPCPGPNQSDTAQYVLCFGDCGGNNSDIGRVAVDNLGAFTGALENKTAFNKMDKVEQEGDPATTLQLGRTTPSSTKPVAYIHVEQRKTGSASEPCTIHVTQKVGLDNLDDVTKVLSHLKPQKPQP